MDLTPEQSIEQDRIIYSHLAGPVTRPNASLLSPITSNTRCETYKQEIDKAYLFYKNTLKDIEQQKKQCLDFYEFAWQDCIIVVNEGERYQFPEVDFDPFCGTVEDCDSKKNEGHARCEEFFKTATEQAVKTYKDDIKRIKARYPLCVFGGRRPHGRPEDVKGGPGLPAPNTLSI